MNSNVKTAVFWVVIICVAVLLYAVVHTGKAKVEDQPTFTDLMNYVEQGKVKSVVVNSTTGDVTGYLQGFRWASVPSNIPTNYPTIYDLMRTKGVK